MKSLTRRPKYISLLCIIGFIWSLLNFLVVFSPAVKKVGIFYPAALGFLVAARFISMIGTWHMKKWGVLLFLISSFISILMAILLNNLGVLEIILTLYFGFSFIFYFEKMDNDL